MISLESHPAIKLMVSNDTISTFFCKRRGRKLRIVFGQGCSPLHYFVSIRPEVVENERDRLENPHSLYDDETFRYYSEEKRIEYLRTKPLQSFVYNNHHRLPAKFKVSVSNNSPKYKTSAGWMRQILDELHEVLKLEKK